MAPLASPSSHPLEEPHPRGGARAFRAVLAVGLLVAVGLGGAYVVGERLDPVYGPARARVRQLIASAGEIESITLGNSHSRAIDFEALGLEGRHLWSPGTDYYGVLIAFRAVRPHLPGLDYLFVTVSPYTVDNTRFADRVEHRAEMYAVAGTYRPVAGDWGAVFRALIRPVVRTDNWEGAASAFVRGLAGRPRRPDAARDPDGVATAAEMRRQAPARAAYHRMLEARSLEETAGLCADARAALLEIATRAAPAHVVFYTAPLSPAYRSHYGDATGCALDAHAAALAEALPNVSYFDDRALPGFDDDSGYFRDADHLNGEGARIYSGLLAERLGLR
ncbi:MAG TPA: hypothetical protein VK002_07700 [Rubricoccaceae bacterium]|nr:hypothetical protein [Rubricoccaceae bacterium]